MTLYMRAAGNLFTRCMDIGWSLIGLAALERPIHHFVVSRQVKVQPGQSVLELGAGVIPYHWFYTRGTDCTVVDSHPLSRKIHKALGYKVAEKGIQELPADDKFDFIFANNFPPSHILHHSIYSRLKPGGKFIESYVLPFWGIKQSIYYGGSVASYFAEVPGRLTSTSVFVSLWLLLSYPSFSNLVGWTIGTAFTVLGSILFSSICAKTHIYTIPGGE